MQRDAARHPDADRGDLAVRPAVIGRHPRAAPALDPSCDDAEFGADLDEHALQPPHVGDDVDRIGQPHDRVADELARPVPGDLAAAVDVDHRRAVEWALPRLGALARGVDRRVLEQQRGVGHGVRRPPPRAARAAGPRRPRRAPARRGSSAVHARPLRYSRRRPGICPGQMSGVIRGETPSIAVGSLSVRFAPIYIRRRVMTKLDEVRDTQCAQASPTTHGVGPRRPRGRVLPDRPRRWLVPGQARRRPEERQLVVPAELGRLDEGLQRVGEVQPRCRRSRASSSTSATAVSPRPTRQKIQADAAKFKDVSGVAGDQVGQPQYSTRIVAAVVGAADRQGNGKSETGPRPCGH